VEFHDNFVKKIGGFRLLGTAKYLPISAICQPLIDSDQSSELHQTRLIFIIFQSFSNWMSTDRKRLKSSETG
jgi:hypothetical protein